MSIRPVPRLSLVIAAALASALLLPAGANARSAPTLQDVSATSADGSLDAATHAALEQGYLVPDQAAYERAKARANAAAAARAPAAASDALDLRAPVETDSWDGVFDTGSAPSDSTGAVGNTRYIELVNRMFGIYNRSGGTIATGTLNDLFGQAGGANSFDPQIIWDPQTRRFYYAGDTIRSATDKLISFGFSTTASPSNGTTDWCHYEVGYGSNLPDYPKLGDSRHFAIIGVNTFDSSNFYLGSDLMGISKPPAGTTCPLASSFDFGLDTDITGPGGAAAFTPVPANQTDTDGTGYVVSRTSALPSNHLVLHRVTRNPDGTPKFQTQGSRVTVGNYDIPADAQQESPSVKLLDTLDARPTQAVSAIDTNHVSTAPGTIWTQHTINGGAGARVRWYEIDPNTRNVVQSDVVQSGTLYNFNAAISPDRAVDGATVSGGNNMVLGYSASGTASTPRIRMVSKIGAGAQSAPVNVRTSPGNYVGFDCAGGDNFCRWGDYAAATPDPRPLLGTTQVWFTNTYASGGTSTAQANWLTRNWAATP